MKGVITVLIPIILTGMVAFLIHWGGVQASGVTLEERVDRVEENVQSFRAEQGVVNQEILRSLGRIEGQVAQGDD